MHGFDIVSLLAVHFIGDFILQSHWMASNKSKSLLALSAHVFVYTWTIAAFILFIWGPTPEAIIFIVGNGVVHFCIDYLTSKWTAALYAQNQTHDFFVVVGLDQWLHATCLIYSLSILLIG